jgi:hypothetical protein
VGFGLWKGEIQGSLHCGFAFGRDDVRLSSANL